MYKKIKIFILLTVITGSLLAVIPALASTQDDVANQLQAAGGMAGVATPQDPRTIAMTIIRYAFGFLGTIFLGLTLYAGYLWMTAGGEEEKVTKATTLLTQAVIGLAIILLSYSITFFVMRTFTNTAQNRTQYSDVF